MSGPSASSSASAAAAAAAARAAEARREAEQRAREAKAAAERAKQAQQQALERKKAVEATQHALKARKAQPTDAQRQQLTAQRKQLSDARRQALDETRKAQTAIHAAEKAQVAGENAATKANELANKPVVPASSFDAIRAENRRSYDQLFGPRAKQAEQGIDGLSSVDARARTQQRVSSAKEALANFHQVKSAVSSDPSQWSPDDAKQFTAALSGLTSAEGVSADTRARLVAQAAPALDRAAGPLSTMIRKGGDDLSTDERRAMYGSISRATELMEPAQQEAFAKKFAQSMGDVPDIGGADDEFGGIMRDSIESGAGASLSCRIVRQLSSDGRTAAANSSAGYINDAVDQLQSDFHDARDSLAQVNQRAMVDIQSFGVKGPQAQQALARFRDQSDWEQKQADYQATGGKLASTLDGLNVMKGQYAQPNYLAGQTAPTPFTDDINSLADKSKDIATKDLDDLARTKGGADVIANAVEASGDGQKTFLDDLKLASRSTAAKHVQSAIISAVGQRFLSLSQGTNLDEAARNRLVSGMDNLADTFGVSRNEMSSVTHNFTLAHGGAAQVNATAPVRKASAAIDQLENQGKFSGKLAGGFRGLSLAIAIGTGGLKAQDVKSSASSLGLTNDAVRGGFDIVSSYMNGTVSKGAAGASELLAKLGGPLAAAATVVSGANAIDQFSHGNTAGGISASLMTAGNVAFMAAPFLGGAGTLVAAGVGVALTAAAVAVSLFSSPPDPFQGDQDKIKDALTSWGVNDDLAGTLSDCNADGQSFGPYINSAAKAAGVPTLTLLHRMNGWSEDQVSQFLDVARMSHDNDGDNGNRLDNASAVVGDDLAQAMQDGRYKQEVDKKTGLQDYNDEVMKRVGTWLNQTDGLLHDAPLPVANVFAPPTPVSFGNAPLSPSPVSAGP